MRFFRNLRAFLFPERCPYCGCLAAAHENACENCRKELERKHAPIIRGAMGFRCVSSFAYGGKVRRMILRIKNYDRTQYTPQVAAVLAQDIRSAYGENVFDLITAVPMFRSDMKHRRYNQSALLAKALSKQLSIPYRDTLRKVKKTKKQHEISYQERKANLKGAFQLIDSGLVKGKRILIIDDVVTSGTTLGTCCKELNKAKPQLICCATLANAYRSYHPDTVI